MGTMIYKIELMVADLDNVGESEICALLRNTKFIYPTVMSVESRDIGEWRDNHPLNLSSSSREAFKELFADPENI